MDLPFFRIQALFDSGIKAATAFPQIVAGECNVLKKWSNRVLYR
jgi:hypothetical protein